MPSRAAATSHGDGEVDSAGAKSRPGNGVSYQVPFRRRGEALTCLSTQPILERPRGADQAARAVPAVRPQREGKRAGGLVYGAKPPAKSGRACLGLGLCVLLGSGCALFHRNPPLPAIIIPQPPLIFPAPPPAPVPPPEVLAPAPAPAPDWQLALDLGAPPPLPPRRAPAAPKPVPAPAPAAPPPPLLNSGLSPAQQEAYRGNTSAILQRVQNDLKILQQRTLTGSAAATRAQAAEYVRQAQQALTQGDLVRAGTLAGKAETLARFLLGE